MYVHIPICQALNSVISSTMISPGPFFIVFEVEEIIFPPQVYFED